MKEEIVFHAARLSSGELEDLSAPVPTHTWDKMHSTLYHGAIFACLGRLALRPPAAHTLSVCSAAAGIGRLAWSSARLLWANLTKPLGRRVRPTRHRDAPDHLSVLPFCSSRRGWKSWADPHSFQRVAEWDMCCRFIHQAPREAAVAVLKFTTTRSALILWSASL